MKLGDNIKKVAKMHGVSMKDISFQLGVHKSNLSRTINSSRITFEDMEKIACIIGCEVNEFFNVDEPSKKGNEFLCPYCGKPISFSRVDNQ